MSGGFDRGSLTQVVEIISPRSRVLRTQRLGGGLTALTSAVDVETSSGHRMRLVVRRSRAQEGLSEETAEREFRLMGRLFQLGLPVPEPVWVGTLDGLPTVVMRRIPGRPLLQPKDPRAWAEQLARTLAAFHAVPPERLVDIWRPAVFGSDPQVRWDLWSEAMPGSGLLPSRVEAAMSRVPPHVRASPPCLIHGDYWAGNTIWTRGRLRAVVDWEDAGFGIRGYDVAYCRLDIALSVGRRVADDFLASYRRSSGLAMDGQGSGICLPPTAPCPTRRCGSPCGTHLAIEA